MILIIVCFPVLQLGSAQGISKTYQQRTLDSTKMHIDRIRRAAEKAQPLMHTGRVPAKSPRKGTKAIKVRKEERVEEGETSSRHAEVLQPTAASEEVLGPARAAEEVLPVFRLFGWNPHIDPMTWSIPSDCGLFPVEVEKPLVLLLEATPAAATTQTTKRTRKQRLAEKAYLCLTNFTNIVKRLFHNE